MSSKNIVLNFSILSILMITLFIYSLFNQSLNAKQSNFNNTNMENTYRITTESNATINHHFEKAVVEKILQQSGCTGVRLYYSKQKEGSTKLFIIGIDKKRNGNEPKHFVHIT